MALPATASARRTLPTATIDVAARPSIAPLFTLVPGVNTVIALGDRRESVAALQSGRYDSALLLPNSFSVARLARAAGIPERWGYRGDFRALLLTRAVARPGRCHQVEYYRHLTRELGFEDEENTGPSLVAPEDRRAVGAALLADGGWNARAPLVSLAPGAAFGGAKRWPSAFFAALIDGLHADGMQTVLVGSAADRAAGRDVVAAVRSASPPIDLVGRTDLPTLAGVLTQCRALVTNDSGAMHVAAALGVRIVVMFGPTNERETHPCGPGPSRVLTNRVWCRPCMLRECPLTHRCMTGITVDAVLAATRTLL